MIRGLKSYRILIPGGDGRLAQVLTRLLKPQCSALWAPSRRELDLNGEGLAEAVRDFCPHWIVHGAGMTSVNACEQEPERAYEVNALGTKALVAIAARLKCRGIYISTDYVFGEDGPHPLTESSPVGPINAYGRSKVHGELAALAAGWAVGRTAWLWGDGKGFPEFVEGKVRSDGHCVVAEQWGTPTHIEDLARSIIELGPEAHGIYHLVGADRVSRAEWAEDIIQLAQCGTTAIKIRPNADIFHNQAPRPRDSTLCITREDGPKLPGWKSRLGR